MSESCHTLSCLLAQELQAVKGKVEQLTAERDKALSENVIVRQQRDCHADHAQLLVKENRRLVSQLHAIRLQPSQAAANSAPKTHCQKQQRTEPPVPAASIPKPQPEDSAADLCSTSAKRSPAHVLHKKPFDLTKGSAPKHVASLNNVLMQAQKARISRLAR